MIMEGFTEIKGRLILLFIVAGSLTFTSCSPKLYTDQSVQSNGNSAERKQLNGFLNSGTERDLDTKTVSADEIIKTAEQYLGVPHCMGGTTMKCMDCSGLLVRKGDLVFFTGTYETSHFITHSGIFAGSSRFIHTSSKNGVIFTSINDPWWSQRFVFGTRVLK